jgi:very-short-patch-repair endonuclease
MTTSHTWRDLGCVPVAAQRQAGAFTRTQAHAECWTPGQVSRRLRSGCWRRLAGRALVAADAAPTAMALVWAVYLTWPDAVASHRTAALMHGFPISTPPQAEAIVGRPVRSLADLTSHRLELPTGDALRVDGRHGPAVTTARRTAEDCLRTMDADAAAALLPWLVTRDVLSREQLAAAIRQRPATWGIGQLLRLLHDSQGGALSRAERRLHDALRRNQVTDWVANAIVRDSRGIIAVVDVLFGAHRVIVEVDGWASHSDREAFQRDRQRQNRLVNAGYTVLRFTWHDLVHREAEVIAEIRAALAR